MIYVKNKFQEKEKYTIWYRMKRHPILLKIILKTILTTLLITTFVGYMNFSYFHELNEKVISETLGCFLSLPFFLLYLFSAIEIEKEDS